jgi:glycosyltransferase involved in cell wall biosynthesis
LKVLHCVLSLDVGGLERIVVDLVRIGRRSGLDVNVLCLERPGLLAPEATAQGASVFCLNKPAGIIPETVNRAAEYLSQTAPDVIHAHQVGALWYVGQAARRAGTSVVIHTEHIDNVAKATGWWKKIKCRALWRRAARFADFFCCVSADIAVSAARWWTVPRRKIKIVLNGVDTDYSLDSASAASLRDQMGIGADVKVIGSVGRLNEVKCHDLLVRAFAQVQRTFSNAHLLIVGDGPEMSRLKLLAEHLGIQSAVTFAGYQPNPERFLGIMDVFALSSRLEGLPLVLLEAWAAQLPIVSTAVGGIPDLITHSVDGVLIPEGNEAALVEELAALLRDPIKAKALGQNGREVVRARFSVDRMANDYQKLYEELLLTRGSAGR